MSSELYFKGGGLELLVTRDCTFWGIVDITGYHRREPFVLFKGREEAIEHAKATIAAAIAERNKLSKKVVKAFMEAQDDEEAEEAGAKVPSMRQEVLHED